MTEDWNFYFLQVDDKAASIYVDLGAHNDAPNSALPYMAYIRLKMNAPRDDGLSGKDEFDALVAIEDALTAKLVTRGTQYVGRCTTDGCRDFFFYISRPDDWATRVAACMASFKSYRYDANTQEDREWSTYFSYLYPSVGDRQTIENRRVCEALASNGDKLVAAREIDHWAYFTAAKARDAYVSDARQIGFLVRNVSGPDENDDRHCAQLWRSDIPA